MSKGEWHERKVHDPDTRFMGLFEEFGGYGLDTALAASPLSLGVEHQFKKTDCPGGAESRTSESGCMCSLDSHGVQRAPCLESPVPESGLPAGSAVVEGLFCHLRGSFVGHVACLW